MNKETNVRDTLNQHLKELRLPSIRECYEQYAHQAEVSSLSYEKYLLEVLARECEVRHQKRIEKLLKTSHLPLEKALSNFDLKRLPQKVAQQINHLLMGDFLGSSENVLVFGNPGSGKTHLVCAVAQELIYKGYRLYFNTCSLLIQDLLKAKQELRLSRFLKKLSYFEAIIIDDIGYVQQSREEMEVLFTLLAERYERGSIILTSNLPFSKWETIFKDPTTTAAAVDRLVHHSVIIELNLPSYRMEEAKSRMNTEIQEE